MCIKIPQIITLTFILGHLGYWGGPWGVKIQILRWPVFFLEIGHRSFSIFVLFLCVEHRYSMPIVSFLLWSFIVPPYHLVSDWSMLISWEAVVRSHVEFQEKDQTVDYYMWTYLICKARLVLPYRAECYADQTTQFIQIQKSWHAVLRQLCGVRTHVECHDGQSSAAGTTPPLLSVLRYDRPTEKRSEKSRWEMEKIRHCGELLEVAAVVRIGEKRGGRAESGRSRR